jgi:8-oxo-dGTP pyrophosphatase MutT (NUDIX family)
VRTSGATGVILNAGGQVLLVREAHPEWPPDRAPWVTPGGTIEVGETPREAARREILEEAGVVAEIGAFIGVYFSRSDDLLGFAFLAEISSGIPRVPANEEIIDIGWFEPTALPSPCPTLASALIADAVAGVRGVYRELL